MRYRRVFVAGGTYFFTVNLADRRLSLLTDHVDILRNAMQKVKIRHPFHIEAIVILPDHLHALWTLPENDCDYPKRWMLIKMEFSRHMPKNEHISKSRIAKGERNIWQRRYWEHLIRDENDYGLHSLQPRKTRPCNPPRRLAIFIYPQIHRQRQTRQKLG